MKKRITKRLISLLMVAVMLAGCMSQIFAVFAAERLSEYPQAEDLEALVREAIRDGAEMEKKYPNGLFNFLLTQYEINEGDNYIQLAVIRQGGTEGDASVLFRAIDITTSYGDDYEIYLSKEKEDMIVKGENAFPLIKAAYTDTTDLSEIIADNSAEGGANDTVSKKTSNIKSVDGEPTSIQAISLQGVEATGLKDAKSQSTGVESDRKNWKMVSENSDEEKNVRENYDLFLSTVGGSETELTFADGEYVKYLYLFTKDDKVAEAEEQLVMALIQSDDNAPVGGSYSAYVNISDNEEAEETKYKFEQSEVTAGENEVTVTVVRTSGVGYYDTVYVCINNTCDR